MNKAILFLNLILRAKFFFRTPKEYSIIIFDEVSSGDLKNCLSGANFFILQTRFATVNTIYFSYRIFKQIFKNFFKGNLYTIYLVSLIELIKPKIVITIIDNSLKFSQVAKILEKKINFIAVQQATRVDFLDFKYLFDIKKTKTNFLKKLYIPNFYCFSDYDVEFYKKLNINVKNFYPIGNLRFANFLEHKKKKNISTKKFDSDICLIFQYHNLEIPFKDKDSLDFYNFENKNIAKGLVKLVKYTIKFCIKNNMKLTVPLKRDKKYSPLAHEFEIDFLKRNLNNKEEFDYIRENLLEKNQEGYTSFKAVVNSKITVSTFSTLLRDKLSVGGKILSCNLTKIDRYNFPFEGICTLNNCSYEEFEKRLIDIYSMSKEDYFSKVEEEPNYIMKFNKDISTISLIKNKLSELGVYKKINDE